MTTHGASCTRSAGTSATATSITWWGCGPDGTGIPIAFGFRSANCLVAIEEYLSTRETAEFLADPVALRSLAEARESELVGDVVYGTEAARALLAERKK